MIKAVTNLFKRSERDYAGRRIDEVISGLAARTSTNIYDWSYIADEKKYENTANGMKVYPHEVSQA